MKRYFFETNAYNGVLFVDDNNRAFSSDHGKFDWTGAKFTLDDAKRQDYSGAEGCETAEEIAAECGEQPDDVFDFNEGDYENLIEF